MSAREAIRYPDYVTAAPVHARCYRLEMTRWAPDLGLKEDTIFSTPPREVIFTAVKMNVLSGAPNSFRVEPLHAPYSVHGPGDWSYKGDSLFVTWSTGFSGLQMRLHVARDTLSGKASTFWDFSRTTQTAVVRGIPVQCGEDSHHPLGR